MQSLQALISDFQRMRGDVTTFIDRDLPRIIGIESVKIVKENFINESYNDGVSVTKWPPRKESTNASYDRGKNGGKYRSGKNSTFKGSVYSGSKPLLRQTLALFNSIKYSVSGGYVFIGTNLDVVPYAAAHNQGLGHEPRRQYMPTPNDRNANPKIMSAVYRKAKYELENRMKKFRI